MDSASGNVRKVVDNGIQKMWQYMHVHSSVIHNDKMVKYLYVHICIHVCSRETDKQNLECRGNRILFLFKRKVNYNICLSVEKP